MIEMIKAVVLLCLAFAHWSSIWIVQPSPTITTWPKWPVNVSRLRAPQPPPKPAPRKQTELSPGCGAQRPSHLATAQAREFRYECPAL